MRIEQECEGGTEGQSYVLTITRSWQEIMKRGINQCFVMNRCKDGAKTSQPRCNRDHCHNCYCPDTDILYDSDQGRRTQATYIGIDCQNREGNKQRDIGCD